MLGLLEKKKEQQKTFATGGIVTSSVMNWPVSSVTYQWAADQEATYAQDHINYTNYNTYVQQNVTYANYAKSFQTGEMDAHLSTAPTLAETQRVTNFLKQPEQRSLRERLVEVLEKASALIAGSGWVQGSYYMPGQGFCLLGALQYAVSGMLPMNNYAYTGGRDTSLLNAARIVLGEVISKDSEGGTRDIPTWNDKHGRTKEDVQLALKRGIEYVNEHYQ